MAPSSQAQRRAEMQCCYAAECVSASSEEACDAYLDGRANARRRASSEVEQAAAGRHRLYDLAPANVRYFTLVDCELLSVDSGVFPHVNAGSYWHCAVSDMTNGSCERVPNTPVLWPYDESRHAPPPGTTGPYSAVVAGVSDGRGSPDIVAVSMRGDQCAQR